MNSFYKINQSTHQNETNSGILSVIQSIDLISSCSAKCCMSIMLSKELLGEGHTLLLSCGKSELQILCGMMEWTQSSLSDLLITLADNEAWSAWLIPFSMWFCKSLKNVVQISYVFFTHLCSSFSSFVLVLISFLTSSYIAENIK